MDKLEPVHRQAAGIDIGSAENYVAVPMEAVAPGESAVRVFGVFSQEQDTLVEWLRSCQITTVAMEATGVYWLTLYDRLQAAGIEVYLVDPHGVKSGAGSQERLAGLPVAAKATHLRFAAPGFSSRYPYSEVADADSAAGGIDLCGC
ncbi:hypothetical protein COW64_20715 [bacterium (Candidatus Blackallbacteria) CG18_big_fil_WC_8_21_14_2_50_49_26]|nr:MAG: hypothetical protein COW64_20715 [bacterium (Candidatus Blackallbacteria) CG18_big_fil_WC_8_21_14_2_50_49_26]